MESALANDVLDPLFMAEPLSIYGEEFTLSAPVKLPKDATLPLVIPATLTYQACQGAVCFPPRKLKFDITIPAAR